MKLGEVEQAADREVYEKRGGKYYKLGMLFSGFPEDGVYVVVNGREALVRKLEEAPTITDLAYWNCYKPLLNVLKTRQRNLPAGTLSMPMAARLAVGFFAKLAKKEMEKNGKTDERIVLD